MPGAGSMDHMVKTIRNNKKLLRKKGMFKKERSFLQMNRNDLTTSADGIASEYVSEEKLSEIRSNIRSARKKRNLQLVLFLFVSLPLILGIGFYLLHDFNLGFEKLDNTGPNQINIEEQQALADERSEKKDASYRYYLEDGDAWLQKKSYHNAIFQYNKAIAVYPSEFAAQYRLAIAYSYQCQYEFKGCEEGMELIKKLEKAFPNNEKIEKVKTIFEHWGTADSY